MDQPEQGEQENISVGELENISMFFMFSQLTPCSPIRDACLPIVYVPVHIVMGMPMTVGMRMRVAITMGIKNT